MIDSIILAVELIGIISFAISGSVVAIDKEMDFIGVIFLAMTTCFGGGIMRDLVLGRTPLFFTSMPLYVCVGLSTSVIIFLLAKIFKKWYVRRERLVLTFNNIIDAAGIGAFSVSGVKMCLELCPEKGAFLAIMMGMISAVGGGMVRDVCLRDIPFVLRKHIYVLACLFGATLYYVLDVYFIGGTTVGESIAAVISMLAVFTIRVLATTFKWNMPKAIEFSKIQAENAANSVQTDEKA